MTETLTFKDRVHLDFEMEDAILSRFPNAEGAYHYLYVLAMSLMGEDELREMHHHIMSDHYARMSL